MLVNLALGFLAVGLLGLFSWMFCKVLAERGVLKCDQYKELLERILFLALLCALAGITIATFILLYPAYFVRM
jgi:hypothetical protein